MEQNPVNIFGVITFATAVVGAVLGIINTIYNINKDRIKLRVRPVFAYTVGASQLKSKYIGVEIINISSFPVSINEAGFTLKGSKQRAVILNPLTHKGEVPLPYKLPSREKITLYADYDSFIQDPYFVRCAYCETSCGITAKGKSKAIKDINDKKLQHRINQLAR